MSGMELATLVLQCVLIAATVRTLADGFFMNEEKKCQYTRPNKLLSVNCLYMNLKEVPQNLKKTSFEIFDLSFNRIRKLKVSSFEKYRNIEFLLLYENIILSIELGTFEQLTSLQEIDLGSNALTTIPAELLQMPSMRNIYMASNELTDLLRDMDELKRPISAPLEYLNVADCGLRDLPDLGVLPRLWQINASHNALDKLNVTNFANMCKLTFADLMYTSLGDCPCQQLSQHFSYTGVDMKYVPVCKKVLKLDECPSLLNDTAMAERFQRCKTTPTKAEVRRLWYFIAGCIGGVALILLVVACCIRSMRRRKKRRLMKRKAAQSSAKLVISPCNATNNYEQNDRLMRCDEV